MDRNSLARFVAIFREVDSHISSQINAAPTSINSLWWRWVPAVALILMGSAYSGFGMLCFIGGAFASTFSHDSQAATARGMMMIFAYFGLGLFWVGAGACYANQKYSIAIAITLFCILASIHLLIVPW